MIQTFLKNEEKSQINNLTYHLKELEKEKTKLRVSKRKVIRKMRTNKISIKPRVCFLKR